MATEGKREEPKLEGTMLQRMLYVQSGFKAQGLLGLLGGGQHHHWAKPASDIYKRLAAERGAHIGSEANLESQIRKWVHNFDKYGSLKDRPRFGPDVKIPPSDVGRAVEAVVQQHPASQRDRKSVV